MKPSAPAFATAATSSARPTHCMPPWTIGCSTPNVSVNLVVIVIGLPRRHPNCAVESDHLAVDHRVRDDVRRERAVLLRLAEPARVRHLRAERFLRLVGQ